MREQRNEDVHAVLNSLEAAGKVDDEGGGSQAGSARDRQAVGTPLFRP